MNVFLGGRGIHKFSNFFEGLINLGVYILFFKKKNLCPVVDHMNYTSGKLLF